MLLKSQQGGCKEEALIVGVCSQQEYARGDGTRMVEQYMGIGMKWKVQRGYQQDQQRRQPQHVEN